MRYSPKLLLHALTGLLILTSACTTFEDNAVATDPTVVGLEAEVVKQQKVVEQTKQEARRAQEMLKAKESQLDAAKHGLRAEEAIK
jgi:hypothetical protein